MIRASIICYFTSLCKILRGPAQSKRSAASANYFPSFAWKSAFFGVIFILFHLLSPFKIKRLNKCETYKMQLISIWNKLILQKIGKYNQLSLRISFLVAALTSYWSLLISSGGFLSCGWCGTHF